MKAIILCQKSEFNQKSVDEIDKYAPVTWLDRDKLSFSAIAPLVSDNEDKILALSPEPFDWIIPNEIYAINKLKYLCLPTTSAEFVDLKECTNKGILVTNVPHYSTNAVAEYAIYLMMALFRRLPYQLQPNRDTRFTENNLADELKGKTVGIIGLGNIGTRIAELTAGLGMKVVYWSKRTRNDRFDYCPLDEILKSSDVIFPALTVNDQTRGTLNTKALTNLKNDAYFIDVIDVVGDQVVDRKYLVSRVENGTLAGVAYESNDEKSADYKSNVLVTPALAWYTKQSLENDIEIWKATIISCIKGMPINLVT